MARLNMGNVTMRARESGTGGLIRFEVTDPNSGAVYNLTGCITDLEINMERPEVGREFGSGLTFATGPASTTMTFTVRATTALTRDTYNDSRPVDTYNEVTPDMGAALRGPVTPDPVVAWMDEAIPYVPTPSQLPHITHTFEVNADEPGICARASCGMWPEHHDHDRQTWDNRCVCSECMPDADDLPDDQVVVSMRSETVMRPGPITGQSHP